MAARKVKATFDYLATEPGELSIKKGDVIVVLEEDSTGWWKGDLRGLIGFFPSNFSEPYEEQPSESAWAQRRMSMAPKPMLDNIKTSASNEEFVRAKHNYKGSAADGELSFSKGDIIKVLNKDESGWWKGELNGKVGFLPHNFVIPIAAPATTSTATSQTPAAPAVVRDVTPPPQAASAGPIKSAAAKAKALKGKSPVVGAPPASGGGGAPTAVAATPAPVVEVVSGPDPRVAKLEGDLKKAQADIAASQKSAAEARQAAESAERKLEEVERKLEEANQRADEAELRRERAVQEKEAQVAELQRWEGNDCGDWELNELRDQKHRLKAALEKVQSALDATKACPACEVAVKDCILVPCLHAFCHKCGEKNKKQVKCSVCGLAPERIYLLGGKK